MKQRLVHFEDRVEKQNPIENEIAKLREKTERLENISVANDLRISNISVQYDNVIAGDFNSNILVEN